MDAYAFFTRADAALGTVVPLPSIEIWASALLLVLTFSVVIAVRLNWAQQASIVKHGIVMVQTDAIRMANSRGLAALLLMAAAWTMVSDSLERAGISSLFGLNLPILISVDSLIHYCSNPDAYLLVALAIVAAIRLGGNRASDSAEWHLPPLRVRGVWVLVPLVAITLVMAAPVVQWTAFSFWLLVLWA